MARLSTFFLALLMCVLGLVHAQTSARNYVFESVYTIPFKGCNGTTTLPSAARRPCSLRHYAYFFATRATGGVKSTAACFQPCSSFRWLCARSCVSATFPTRRGLCLRTSTSQTATQALAASCDAACVAARSRCFRGCFKGSSCPVATTFTLDWSVTVAGLCTPTCTSR